MLEIESLKLTDVELADCGYLPRLYPAAARKVADEQLAKVLVELRNWLDGINPLATASDVGLAIQEMLEVTNAKTD